MKFKAQTGWTEDGKESGWRDCEVILNDTVITVDYLNGDIWKGSNTAETPNRYLVTNGTGKAVINVSEDKTSLYGKWQDGCYCGDFIIELDI